MRVLWRKAFFVMISDEMEIKSRNAPGFKWVGSAAACTEA